MTDRRIYLPGSMVTADGHMGRGAAWHAQAAARSANASLLIWSSFAIQVESVC